MEFKGSFPYSQEPAIPCNEPMNLYVVTKLWQNFKSEAFMCVQIPIYKITFYWIWKPKKQILFPSDIKQIFCASFEVSTALYQDSGLWNVKCDAGRGRSQHLKTVYCLHLQEYSIQWSSAIFPQNVMNHFPSDSVTLQKIRILDFLLVANPKVNSVFT